MFVINRHFRKVGFSRSTTAKLQQIKPGVELVTWNTVEDLDAMRKAQEAWLLDGVPGEDAWMDDGETEPTT